MLGRLVSDPLARVGARVDAFDAGSRMFAVARALIAAGQLSILLFTQWEALFVPVEEAEFGPVCSGPGSVSVYCLGDELLSVHAASWVLTGVFVLCIVGFLPRWLGVVHLWATLSLSSSITLPDGGEAVAKSVVLLLMLVSLSDTRLNHWQRGPARRSVLQPLSWAAWHLLRVQMIWIYVNAAVGKTAVDDWVEGSAIYYVTRDPLFGTGGPLADVILWTTAQPVFALAMAWGTIVVEMLIAYGLLRRGVWRPVALGLAVALHGSFIVVIGLWSFALVMIGSVLAATGPRGRRDGPEVRVEQAVPAQEEKAQAGRGTRSTNDDELVRS